MILVLSFAFVAGVLTILAPCTLPVVPLVLGGASGGGPRRLLGLFAGFGASFVVTTVLVAAILASAGLTTDRLRIVAVAVLGLVGLTLAIPRLAAALERHIPARVVRLGTASGADDRGLGAGFAIGSGIGLVWAPCVGPIMAAVIAAAVVTGPTPLAVATALAYVAGAIVPLAAIARWGRRATTRIDGRRSDRLRRAFGIAMTATAVLVVTGVDVPLQAGLTAALPAQLNAALFAVEQRPAVQQELTVLRP